MDNIKIKEMLSAKRALTNYEIVEVYKFLESASYDYIEFMVNNRNSKITELYELNSGQLSNKLIKCICTECGEETKFRQTKVILLDYEILCTKCYNRRNKRKEKYRARSREYYEKYKPKIKKNTPLQQERQNKLKRRKRMMKYFDEETVGKFSKDIDKIIGKEIKLQKIKNESGAVYFTVVNDVYYEVKK